MGLAAFAMVWAIVRAHVQSITIDEAVTFTNFVRPVRPTFWTAHANNHLLNSILTWGFARVFRASNLVARSGALIGAAVYILASYFLSSLVADRFLLRVFLFICLVFNPFIFDYLVAARGYGLASGFLLSAICFVAYALAPNADNRRVLRACILASLSIALSFVSNFSFALVDAATIVMLYLWASKRASAKTRLTLAAACFLPALLVAATLSVPVLLRWNRAELNYGAASLGETFASLYQASFYQLIPVARKSIFMNSPSILLPSLGLFAVWQARLILIHWRSERDARSRWLAAFAAVPIVAVAAALLMHWILFRIMKIPLPLDRTGIYVVVLITLFLGILTAVPIPTRAGALSRRGLTILMVILGSYFLLCIRVSYFKEWKWDSDTDKLYSVLAAYNHSCGLKDIGTNWHYDAALNYYRNASGRETFPKIPPSDDLAPGKRAYVLYDAEDRGFLVSRGLNVVYRTPSGALIALDPAFVPSLGESPCPIKPPDPGK